MSSTVGTARAATPRSTRRVPDLYNAPQFQTPRLTGAFFLSAIPEETASRAQLMARSSSAGRNGFCRQTTSARSDGRDTASRVAIPEHRNNRQPGRALAHRRDQVEAGGVAQKDIDDHSVESRSSKCPER